ncbi:MAG TPA: tRNA dihydrouridine(20/20a) synthase DusA [Gammaproteobacteria bacterium]|nr:tRNA dihydrouridine(20/20a) synthase DusA [Gammaproteobacteria bacterium]
MTESHRFSIAPMMDCTDRHFRYLARLLSRHTLLYTEMVTTGALLHGDIARHLAFDAAEHPLALQIGGSDPIELAQAARLAEEWGYDEINVNVGCPSDRVQSGRFGACLMREPQLVADGVAAMQAACRLPVTVKTRIGIDRDQDGERLFEFVDTVAAAGCDTFIVHARNAWLKGLSPKQNREIPPLRYDVVYRLKQERPDLTIAINGGIKSLEAARTHLEQVDGVMVGREAYSQPYFLAAVDGEIFGDRAAAPDRDAVLEAYLPYVSRQRADGVPFNRVVKPLFGLYQGCPGARRWRRHLSGHASKQNSDERVIMAARETVAAA